MAAFRNTSCLILKTSTQTHSAGSCIRLQITREKKYMKWRWTSPYWVKKDTNYKDYNLTKDSWKMMDEIVIDREKNKISPLKDEPWERQPYVKGTIRSGVVAIKIGCHPQWLRNGQKIYCTLFQVLDNHVVDHKSPEEYAKTAVVQNERRSFIQRRWGACIVGAVSSDPRKHTPHYNKLFLKSGVPVKRMLSRFIITENAGIQPGTPMLATHFRPGDTVDVQGKTTMRGFQGVMKRWGFRGGPKTHGTSKWHRRGGTIAGNEGKVVKGTKMPGHMGGAMRTVLGAKIVRINTKHNVIYIHGCFPGAHHGFVRIMDSKLPKAQKLRLENPPPMPTIMEEDLPDDLPEDLYRDDVFPFEEETVTYAEEAS